jgi:hypothetical protein
MKGALDFIFFIIKKLHSWEVQGVLQLITKNLTICKQLMGLLHHEAKE